MDEYSRHLKLWHALYAMNSGWITRKFNMTYEDLHVDGPALIVPNHVSAWDPLLVAMSLRDKQAYFVASEHLFRMGPVSKLLEFVVAPIPRRKHTNLFLHRRGQVEHKHHCRVSHPLRAVSRNVAHSDALRARGFERNIVVSRACLADQL